MILSGWRWQGLSHVPLILGWLRGKHVVANYRVPRFVELSEMTNSLVLGVGCADKKQGSKARSKAKV